MSKDCLEPNGNAAEEERDIFFNIINRYIGLYTREAHRSTKNDTSHEYPFIAMDTRQVFEQIQFVSRYLKKTGQAKDKSEFTFLDIGCGTGNVLLIAEQFDFDVYGIEKDDYPCTIARQLIDDAKILQEDIRGYKHYDKYDVVYYFCPFSDGKQQRQFERFIEDQMRTGGILIANQKRSEDIASDARFKKIHEHYHIWQKCL